MINATYIGKVTGQAIYWIGVAALIYPICAVTVAELSLKVAHGQSFGLVRSWPDYLICTLATLVVLFIGGWVAGGLGGSAGTKVGQALGGGPVK